MLTMGTKRWICTCKHKCVSTHVYTCASETDKKKRVERMQHFRPQKKASQSSQRHFPKETVAYYWYLVPFSRYSTWDAKKPPRCIISAVTRYLTAITVYVPRGHKVLPSCLLTCLLITKGHPAGTQCWPLNAKGYSIKTRVRGKEEVIRRAEGMTIESYRLKKRSPPAPTA